MFNESGHNKKSNLLLFLCNQFQANFKYNDDMIATIPKIYTVQEYFEIEKKSEIRHEFVYGKLEPMAGESKNANKIASNILRIIADILEEKFLEIYTHDVRTMVENGALYRYPDLVIAPESDDEDSHAVTQPIVIMEVASDSTETKDRGIKLREYTHIPTLLHYLIISQDQQLITLYSKKNDQWVIDFYDQSDEAVELPGIGVSLSIQGMYKKVKFDET